MPKSYPFGRPPEPKPKTFGLYCKAVRQGRRNLAQPDLVYAACENATGHPHILLAAGGRGRSERIARSIEMYCLYKYSGLSYDDIAKIYGTTRRTTSEQINMLVKMLLIDRRSYDREVADLVDTATFALRMMRNQPSVNR